MVFLFSVLRCIYTFTLDILEINTPRRIYTYVSEHIKYQDYENNSQNIIFHV